LSSLGEGYALGLAEAACCGLPIITTDWCGPQDFLTSDELIKPDGIALDHNMNFFRHLMGCSFPVLGEQYQKYFKNISGFSGR